MAASVHALTPTQERKLVSYLEEQFLEITRGYTKRSQPTSNLRTLSAYLSATRQILSIILQIPPIDPSTSLRTTFLLRLTGEAMMAIPGYAKPIDAESMRELLDWLDDLDSAWLVVLQVQVWDPDVGGGVDLEVPADDVVQLKSSPMSQTERTRLRSLLVGGTAALEEWLAETDLDGEDMGVAEGRMEGVMESTSVQQGFDDLFSRTLAEMGALAGTVSDPDGMRGTC